MVNAQQWLDQNYPKNTRKNVKELDISNKNLEGELDLEDFVDLIDLDCSNNKITEIKFSTSNYKNLKNLVVKNNNFSYKDFFDLWYEDISMFVNLKGLDISNNCPVNDSDYSVLADFPNLPGYKSSGGLSLEAIKGLKKLEMLDISDTNINKGIEYLPNSIQIFHCKADNPQAKVGEIYNKLKEWECIANEEEGFYDLKKYKGLRAAEKQKELQSQQTQIEVPSNK